MTSNLLSAEKFSMGTQSSITEEKGNEHTHTYI